jgi:DinB superfamily
MVLMDHEHLRFPVGRFTMPDMINAGMKTEWIQSIESFPDSLEAEVNRISVNLLDSRYRPDGWTARQVIHHLADSHMNAYIRFKLALTEDNPTIKPYKEEKWAELQDSVLFPVSGSVALLRLLHQRWAVLLKTMSDADFGRTYYHPESKKTFTLLQALAMYDWHCRNHLGHLKSIG